MELTMRTATPAERLYTAEQSMQIAGQTGYVGNLRADMGKKGTSFIKTWKSSREGLDTEEFQGELKKVLRALIHDEQYGGFLKSRDAMGGFCQEHPENSIDGHNRDFGFRADTGKYTYMLRLNPNRGEYNLYIYCYVRELLDSYQ